MDKLFRMYVIIHIDRAQSEILALLGPYGLISATENATNTFIS